MTAPSYSVASDLAINGGKPVRAAMLPYGRQSITEADIQAVVEVLRSDWLTTGPKVAEFEEAFADYVGARYAVSFSSGTAALHGAAFVAGLQPGDEAITTPLTFVATANALLYVGARPVFADVDPETLNLAPQKASTSITPRTRAILPVDFAGHPSAMDSFLDLAAEHGLTIIEDASHALGATYRKRRTGSLAHMTTFSFHPVKHLATGEGGMVTTQDPKLADSLRRFRNHGISSDARQRLASGQWFYEVEELGFNYRLTDVASALGLSQLSKLDANLARRRAIAAIYREAFQSLPALALPGLDPEVEPAWHLYAVRLNLDTLTAGRAAIFRALRAENIGVNVHYIPVHLHAYYRKRFGYSGKEFPVAENAYDRLLSLPLFHGMSDQDVQDVITAVGKVLTAFAR
jgi:UDP-4-amino-4,6-dideoxy-N-acetyl-beta-L-altrosamine transaminase